MVVNMHRPPRLSSLVGVLPVPILFCMRITPGVGLWWQEEVHCEHPASVHYCCPLSGQPCRALLLE